MDEYFKKYKTAILPEIDTIFSKNKAVYSKVNPWGNDASDKLYSFVKQGKMIRGGLVYLSAEMFGIQTPNAVLQIAAAIEIIHSGLLIHDDIIDKDTVRRHNTSIYKQYENYATSRHVTNASHIGQSLGICLGDLSFFMGWTLLAGSEYTNKHLVLQKIAHELSLVGIAQMQDILPSDDSINDQERILSMYQYKTGRYSFSLPLSVGGLLAGQPNNILLQLEELGTAMGILFQIADDRLNIFGNTDNTGKETGSDVREGKYTLYRALLFQHASIEERQKFSHIFGNAEMTPADLAYIQLLIKKYAVENKIQLISNRYRNSANEIIKALTISPEYKAILFEILDFIQERKQ